jgi:hypothetical protein
MPTIIVDGRPALHLDGCCDRCQIELTEADGPAQGPYQVGKHPDGSWFEFTEGPGSPTAPRVCFGCLEELVEYGAPWRESPAAALGRKGGRAGRGVSTPAKARAARENGKKGGRPPKREG